MDPTSQTELENAFIKFGVTDFVFFPEETKQTSVSSKVVYGAGDYLGDLTGLVLWGIQKNLHISTEKNKGGEGYHLVVTQYHHSLPRRVYIKLVKFLPSPYTVVGACLSYGIAHFGWEYLKASFHSEETETVPSFA